MAAAMAMPNYPRAAPAQPLLFARCALLEWPFSWILGDRSPFSQQNLQGHIQYLTEIAKFLGITTGEADFQVAMTQPVSVTNCNIDMKRLISDQNRSIATLAVTTLVKTGNESSVERLMMKQITNFMSDIGAADKDVKEFLFGIPLVNLETSLKNYYEPSEEPCLDLNSLPREVKSQPLTVKIAQGKKPTGIGAPPSGPASTVFKSSAPVLELKEAEKFIFDKQLLENGRGSYEDLTEMLRLIVDLVEASIYADNPDWSIDDQVPKDIQLIDAIVEKQAQLFSEECKLFPADVQIQSTYPLHSSILHLKLKFPRANAHAQSLEWTLRILGDKSPFSQQNLQVDAMDGEEETGPIQYLAEIAKFLGIITGEADFQEPSEEPLDLNSVPMEVKSQPLTEKKAQGKKPTGIGVPPRGPASTVDAYEKLLSSIPGFSSFGKLFKSSAPVELTEVEKHIFDNNPEQLLENVDLPGDADDPPIDASDPPSDASDPPSDASDPPSDASDSSGDDMSGDDGDDEIDDEGDDGDDEIDDEGDDDDEGVGDDSDDEGVGVVDEYDPVYNDPVYAVRPGPRFGHTLTYVAAIGEEGEAGYVGPRLILFGGTTTFIACGLHGGRTNAVHSYDIVTNTWSRVNPLGQPPVARTGHAAIAVGAMVVIYGGHLADANLYVLNLALQSPMWHSVYVEGPGLGERYGHRMAFVEQRYIMCIGGYDGDQCLDDVWAWDTDAKPYQWVRLEPEGQGPPPCLYATASVRDDDVLWHYGGIADLDHDIPSPLSRTYTLTHIDNSWVWAIAPVVPPVGRYKHAAVFVNAHLHVSGGFSSGEVAVLDTTTCVWCDTNPSAELTPRILHAAAAVGNHVYVYGGLLRGAIKVILVDDLLIADDPAFLGRYRVVEALEAVADDGPENAMLPRLWMNKRRLTGSLLVDTSIDMIQLIAEYMELWDLIMLGRSHPYLWVDVGPVYIRRVRHLKLEERHNLYFEIGLKMKKFLVHI